ncbi:hypothetical protein [Olleya sp. Bg11-27]|uniref:hypothetical protein n=1 Tax=Olleya sp. Bg11-27 TaxID=2058135 RepID=UPI000C31B7B4|nr:hypothetical protein [Olleya sp. Bg11-27]AUC75816.1 hypothetical protein CW732_09040 [Olleya sp. Bg11-27]
MCKILMTSDYNSPNTYVKSIVDELNKTHEVLCDVDGFWKSSDTFDIIHIQWIEELFNWSEITENNLSDLKKQFLYWKTKGAKIVITKHNKLPHRIQPLGEVLYSIAYKNVDAVVHLGAYSFKEYDNRNNVIIPHVNYSNLVEVVNKKEAKQYLNVPLEGNLLLSFGVIRDVNEEEQIIKAFKKIKTKKDYLLICNSLRFNKKPSFRKKPLARIQYNVEKYIYKRQHVLFRRKRVLNSDLKYYFNAADIIISPRINTLNSGVIYMGFSFSKVVIGPNIGNIGQILKGLNNPVFEPNNIQSIAKSMLEANFLVGTATEKQNFEYANTVCTPYMVASKHNQLYNSLLND